MLVGFHLSFTPQSGEESNGQGAEAYMHASNIQCNHRKSWTPISYPMLVGFQLSFASQSDEESNSKGAEAGGQAAPQEHGHGLPQPPQKQKI